jgi:ribosomal protein S18 acetylase RimI-like enzyme
VLELSLRPAGEGDMELLYEIFASTRGSELAYTPWTDAEREAFLRLQFKAQHTHYQKHYAGASFDILLVDGAPAGRLYVLRGDTDIRIIDIALLPGFRNAGIGTRLFRELSAEADREHKLLSIHVEVQNRARRLYDRLDFKVVQDDEVYLLMERAPAETAVS